MNATAQASAASPPASPPGVLRGAGTHLGISLVALILLPVAQIYALVQMSAHDSPGAAHTAFVIASGLFMMLTSLSLLRQCVLMAFACMGAIRASRSRGVERTRWPGVSVLVPAYNEGERVAKAVEAILKLDYPSVEVIVVDDGSTDDTLAHASKWKGQHGTKQVRVITKQNGGKWSALNLGFHQASHELIVCVDADSQLTPESLKQLARHFDDPSLGACCGKVSVRNCANMITRMQALEYDLLNGMLRQAQSAFGTVLVAPGPLSMFRRSVLEKVWRTFGRPQPLPLTRPGARVYGPWEDDTFAEDADLTLNVLLTGHGVTYETLAISRTTAPDSISRLLNQRYRWTRGNFQAVVKAWRRCQQSSTPRRMVMVWLGAFLAETTFLPAMNLLAQFALLGVTLTFGFQPSMALWLVLLVALDANEVAFSAKLEHAEKRSIVLSLLSRVLYNVILDVNRVFALADELRGTKMRWS